MVLTKGAEKHFAEHINSRRVFDGCFWINLFYFSGIFEKIAWKKLRIQKIAQLMHLAAPFLHGFNTRCVGFIYILVVVKSQLSAGNFF